jgi:S-formylglutathione hydrolase FrmB
MRIHHLLILCSILSISFAQATQPCHENQTYRRCDRQLAAPELGLHDIPVFFYHSLAPNTDRPIEYIVFLHGRGYSRDINANDSMLEHMGIEQILSDPRFSHLVFVAPQDVVVQSDDQRRGQDYWIGDESRDWLSFLGQHLPKFIIDYSSQQNRKGAISTILGVSMGAHGALLTSSLYPEQYSQVIALSPIFRPVSDEIDPNDFDVFFRNDMKSSWREINIGTQLLDNVFTVRPSTFISISSTDFGLDEKRFPLAKMCWANLLPQHQAQDKINITISADPRGHSMGFWRDTLIESLVWLQD